MIVVRREGSAEFWEDVLHPDGNAIGGLGVVEEAGSVRGAEGEEEV